MERTYTINKIPPSNNQFMGRGTKKTNSTTYQNIKTEWAWLVLAAVGKFKPKKPIEKSVVNIHYRFPDRRRRDPDNYSGKFLLDGLVKAGVIKDDSFNNITLNLSASYDKDNPATVIVIQEV